MGPSTLVEAGDHKFLFDVGRGATANIRALGLKLGDIREVFLTHLHFDHVAGLADLWLTGHHPGDFGQRVEPMVVHGPVGIAPMVEGLKSTYSEMAHAWRLPDATFRITVSEFSRAGVVYQQDGIRITAFRVPHEDRDAYGYKIEHQGRAVVISGDTAFSDEVIRQAKQADLLIHEVFYADLSNMAPALIARLRGIHTEPEEAVRVFREAQPKLAVATHLGQAAEDTRKLEAGVRAGYSGQFVVGEDLMTFVVGDSVSLVRR
jgi:ribonuclease Z